MKKCTHFCRVSDKMFITTIKPMNFYSHVVTKCDCFKIRYVTCLVHTTNIAQTKLVQSFIHSKYALLHTKYIYFLLVFY
jgi:hypothetical protein